jgi:hypothetical protein
MNRILVSLVFLLSTFNANAQKSSETWIVAFPITDYMVPSDSIQIVQVDLTASGISIDKQQIGLLKGIYRNGKADTAAIGYGKCHLIKGAYYYFPIRISNKAVQPQAGDLLYTRIAKPAIYMGLVPQLAAQAIVLQSVEDSIFYTQLSVLQNWTMSNEESLLKAMVKDINYTGKAMKEQMPAANKAVASGKYKTALIFDVLQNAKKEELVDFLNYMIARPHLYAGNTWKVSEVFATWADGGAPVVK